jgi:ESSS subunit of NADH:ubiquinone oxidoreductase (complex I)
MLSTLVRAAVVARTGRTASLCRTRFFGSGGGHHSDVPVPQSQHAKLFAGHPESEGWESTVAWFYPTSFLLIVAVLVFEPETSINVWAKQEAAARLKLKEEGFTDFVFGVHYQDLGEEKIKEQWDKFSSKALRMTDDDDDDEEEEEEEEEEDDE